MPQNVEVNEGVIGSPYFGTLRFITIRTELCAFSGSLYTKPMTTLVVALMTHRLRRDTPPRQRNDTPPP
eukprot:COSAG02_NODE_5966_length_3904_cov_4.469648_3_plen_69_part_00